MEISLSFSQMATLRRMFWDTLLLFFGFLKAMFVRDMPHEFLLAEPPLWFSRALDVHLTKLTMVKIYPFFHVKKLSKNLTRKTT